MALASLRPLTSSFNCQLSALRFHLHSPIPALSLIRRWAVCCCTFPMSTLHSCALHAYVYNFYVAFHFYRFEVFAMKIMKSKPCIPLKVSRRFGRKFHLHLQGRIINRARKQRVADYLPLDSFRFLARLIL